MQTQIQGNYNPYSLEASATLHQATMAAFRAQDAGDQELVAGLDQERVRMLLYQAPTPKLNDLLERASRIRFAPSLA